MFSQASISNALILPVKMGAADTGSLYLDKVKIPHGKFLTIAR